MAPASMVMTQIHQFDFRAAAWINVADALCDFRTLANSQCIYAYVKASPGLQQSMIERLVADLDLEDHICMDSVAATNRCDINHPSVQHIPANRPFRVESLLRTIMPQRVARLE